LAGRKGYCAFTHLFQNTVQDFVERCTYRNRSRSRNGIVNRNMALEMGLCILIINKEKRFGGNIQLTLN
jgi:hypothetical protein